ncbi:MAG TPA: hypothetical protein VM469_00095 [Pseudoxanthomonas sp.]|jgi:hypothetical protein|nr:hypothetical protein [Pseudoxanthomonas sp.]
MNPKLLNTLSGLSATAALLALSLYCVSSDSRLQPSAKDGSPLAGIDSAIDASAEVAEAQAQPRRRTRATLSMPYFSFAQSLRPRG